MVIDIGIEYKIILVDDSYTKFYTHEPENNHYSFKKFLHTFYSKKEVDEFLNQYIEGYIKKFGWGDLKTKKDFKKKYDIHIERCFHFSYREHSFDMLPKKWFKKSSKWYESTPDTYKGFPVRDDLPYDVR